MLRRRCPSPHSFWFSFSELELRLPGTYSSLRACLSEAERLPSCMVSQQQISPLVHSIEETILRTNAGHADRRRLRLSQNYPKTLLGLFVLGVFVPELVLLSSSSAAAASSSCSSSAVADASSSSCSSSAVADASSSVAAASSYSSVSASASSLKGFRAVAGEGGNWHGTTTISVISDCFF